MKKKIGSEKFLNYIVYGVFMNFLILLNSNKTFSEIEIKI